MEPGEEYRLHGPQPRVVLEFESVRGYALPLTQRVKRCIKNALRQCGLRCVRIPRMDNLRVLSDLKNRELVREQPEN